LNQQTLLNIYERLESLIGRLPGPLQKAILKELSPIKQIFLAQRLSKIALVGQANSDASALFSALLGGDLRMTDPQTGAGWLTYEHRSKGGLRVLDARRLNDTSQSWSALTGALSEDKPDLLLFLANGTKPLDLGLECEQASRIIDFAQHRHQTQVPLIGVIDFPASAGPAEVESKRLELQAWLSGQAALAACFVKSVAICSFVRFRADGTLDVERDERRNIDELAELMARELPGEAQVEMARLVNAKETQTAIAQRLIRSVTTICAAVGAQPIPLADFPILTVLQVAMVSGLMHLSGRELSVKAATEFFGAVGANIGAGMILREGARAAVKLLPGWGNAISGGVAAAGTYAIGKAASAYFIEGISIAEARRIFRQKRSSKLPKGK